MHDPDLPNTPGVLGYLLAVVIAALALALVLSSELLIEADSRSSVFDVAFGYLVIAGFALVVAVPFAVVGVPLVHMICRPIPMQLVHVLVTGVVTVVEFVLVFGQSGAGGGALVGALTMAGRAAVIPLVRARRERARRELEAFERSNPEIPVG